jgi:glucose-6-phosphate isomerase
MAETALKSALPNLLAHRDRMAASAMTDLFANDPGRFERFSVSLDDLVLDYSKNRIDGAAMAALYDVARAAGVEARRDRMWAGEPINVTEGRAVLHMALRYDGTDPIMFEGRDVMGDVREVLGGMKAFCSGVRGGEITGYTGEKFTDVVNIGIGGSDLGPAMATRALAPYTSPDLKAHFVSNVDGADMGDTLAGLDPATTLFVVASKTFTTDETMTNARTARDWVVAGLGAGATNAHFAAVSTNLAACAEFGISADKVFGFWDWVGGRYSIWSAIGLSLALAVGFENFEQFLAGAAKMDAHFRTAPFEENLPVILALLGIWHRNVWGFGTHAVLPYDQRMGRFAAYLQQQDMESNGKSVRLGGQEADVETGPVIWGEPGTNGQHAFYQLIHQGTSVVPVDFLIAARPHEQLPPHHQKLVANCFAQSEALMVGKSLGEVEGELKAAGMAAERIAALAPHKVFSGNRPSNTLIYRQLDPATLGMLIALYEHKVFVQGTIWDINSFDQWGVELGKKLARALLPRVAANEAGSAHDSSTEGLLAAYHRLK